MDLNSQITDIQNYQLAQDELNSKYIEMKNSLNEVSHNIFITVLYSSFILIDIFLGNIYTKKIESLKCD